jgi:protein-disulfide isomerase
MLLARRFVLSATAAAALAPLGGALAQAPAQTPGGGAADPRLGERSLGRADAPVTVIEYFSLTCSHCAAFHRETFPQVKSELIDTGRVRLVFRDFPLDQLALAAAVTARCLPPERYEGFIGALFASQDRWAFARGVNNLEEIAKIAALAGMSRAEFEACQRDEALRRGVLENRLAGDREHNVQATPSFVFNGGRTQSGNLTYDRFEQLVNEAKPT